MRYLVKFGLEKCVPNEALMGIDVWSNKIGYAILVYLKIYVVQWCKTVTKPPIYPSITMGILVVFHNISRGYQYNGIVYG